MLSIIEKQSSSDNSVKYALQNKDGNKFEAVYFKFFEEKDKDRPYFNYYREKGKMPEYTICLSSQAGCAMGCTFCATGYGGFFKNLPHKEIIEQVSLVQRDLLESARIKRETLGNVILMGMGEPLMNLSNVLKFCRALDFSSSNLIKLISVSTVGVAPKIRELAHVSDVRLKLFFSLHSPFDEERSQIMPINKKYTIKETLEACECFARLQKQKVIVCYLLLKGINNTQKHAETFASLLNPQYFETQILLYNPIPNVGYERTSLESAQSFAKIITDRGVTTDIRVSKGQDVQGGCGQLIKDVKLSKRRNRLA